MFIHREPKVRTVLNLSFTPITLKSLNQLIQSNSDNEFRQSSFSDNSHLSSRNGGAREKNGKDEKVVVLWVCLFEENKEGHWAMKMSIRN